MWSVSSNSLMLGFLKRYSGIMFTHDLKLANMSKGFESPNLQGRVNSPGSSILADTLPWTNVDLFLPSSKLSTWLVWEMFASLEHVLIALIEVEGCDEYWGSMVGASAIRSMMAFNIVRSRNTSLHRYKHEIGTRKEKE
ncbi:hypothetical protein Tco_0142689, partial [Tanacetum coccineum]